MSIYTSKTGLSSILKTYTPTQRDKAKNVAINKVRFDMSNRMSLLEVINTYLQNNNENSISNFLEYIRECYLDDTEFQTIMHDATSLVNQLTNVAFDKLVEGLLLLPWVERSSESKIAYVDFAVEMLVAQTKFVRGFLNSLLELWKPEDDQSERWPYGVPDEKKQNELSETHRLLDRILTVIPVSFNIILETIENKYPYFKKPSHVLAGYVHNLLWLLEYKPIFNEFIFNLLLENLVLLDVNAPRTEIEDTESDNESDDDDDAEETMFKMDDFNEKESSNKDMNHPIAQTLDICMEKVYAFLVTRNPYAPNITEIQKQQAVQFSKALFMTFDRAILAKYNTHHVQFIMFYYSSFKNSVAEAFLNSLWEKIQNPNVPIVIRQAAVGYMASFLARANFLPLSTIQLYLKELSNWSHNYIQNCDQYRSNASVKANLVFYTICQAVFYVIAFRSRNLTADKKCLLFLQSLHLRGLVTCHFNPLRVCLPAVATAFAGVTRAYQLAYCHDILERNARRKLATVYGSECETPEETLDTFFPFDPYLLKLSNKRIQPLYLQYQASDAEENTSSYSNGGVRARKRGDSEMVDEADIDDFLLAEKRQRHNELESQFTYGLSPGFHT